MDIIKAFLIEQYSTASYSFMQISHVSGSLTKSERKKKITLSLWNPLIRFVFHNYTNVRTHMIFFLNKSNSCLLKNLWFPSANVRYSFS